MGVEYVTLPFTYLPWYSCTIYNSTSSLLFLWSRLLSGQHARVWRIFQLFFRGFSTSLSSIFNIILYFIVIWIYYSMTNFLNTVAKDSTICWIKCSYGDNICLYDGRMTGCKWVSCLIKVLSMELKVESILIESSSIKYGKLFTVIFSQFVLLHSPSALTK